MRSVVMLSVILGATQLAAAGDPKFEFKKADEVKDVKGVKWNATAEAGVVFTTGNSETTTATGGFKASRKTGANKLELSASGTYAKSGLRVIYDQNGNGVIDNASEITTVDTLTAESLASKARYDRFLTELNSVFLAALAGRDTPAGKESVFGGQLGYSRSLYHSKTATTVAEIGYDFSRESLVGNSAVAIHSGRLFLGHKAAMTEGADLDASAELLTNFNRETLPTMKDGGAFQDTRLNIKIAISAKIGKNLAFQSSFEAKYDHRPGPIPIKNLAMGFAPEAATLDTIMKASFIYTFVGDGK